MPNIYICGKELNSNTKHMFKEKIVEGLRAKSEIKRFGLSNEAIDRIATAREKTVAEESQVETVLTDAETMRLIAEELMKHRDQEITKRTEAQSAFDDYKAKHPEGNEDPDDKGQQQPDLAKTIAAAVAEAVAPLTEKIATLESSNFTKAALDGAREAFFGGEYAKKYQEEANDAWERAVELNEATGSKMTAEQLAEKAKGYFDKAVARKGVDTSKPFKADSTPSEEKGTLDWTSERERLIAAGKIPADNK